MKLSAALLLAPICEFSAFRYQQFRVSHKQQLHMIHVNDFIDPIIALHNHHSDFTSTLLTAVDEVASSASTAVDEAVTSVATTAAATAEALSPYSKVDKTGFIGFIATYVESAIDLGHNILNGIGVKNNYGYSIIFFTMFVKALTLPLTTKQLESTTKMQQLTPFQQKIQKVYANDEQTKNQMMSQLFQTANVNPLAGCLPALVQIPVFISLYRALQNLVAENKLDEPFLWIPDLQGPVYTNPPGTSMDWIKSAFTGAPNLGWHDTIAFLSLPVILYISQTVSQKILQPPKDPNKVLTEQEEISQGIINNLPFIVAFFSINVPAGLAVYWIINNLLTTLITAIVKERYAKEPVPIEVTRMMQAIEAKATGGVMGVASSKPKSQSSASSELRGFSSQQFKDNFTQSDSRPAGFSKGSGAEVETTADFKDIPSFTASTSAVSNSEDDDDGEEEQQSGAAVNVTAVGGRKQKGGKKGSRKSRK